MDDIFFTPTSDYLRENSLWYATLSDGRVVYQNDSGGNSWIRLKDYLATNPVAITGLSLRFRDHIESLPSGKSGYYFIKSLLASQTGSIQFFYKIGYLDGATVNITKYSVPELVEFEKESVPQDDSYVVECLIINP